MKITVNSKEHDTQAQNVTALVDELGLSNTKVAVAISKKMVPKEQWPETAITEGANIIIIKAVCGG